MAKTTNKPVIQAPVAKPRQAMLSMNRKLALLLGIIAFMVYANTLHNGYVLDDLNVLRDNDLVKSGVSAIPRLLATPYRYGYAHMDNDLYRPLSLVTFAIEYQLFGLDPEPNHFVNIVLFAGCVILLFLFFDRLFGGKKTAVAFIASLLFALHPIHTEVVANVKSRDELLCFFLSFLSLNIFLSYARSGKLKYFVAGSLCFFAALLSKETVITFVAIVPFIFFFYAGEHKKRSAYITTSVVLASFIFIAIRLAVLKYYNSDHLADNDMIENALSNPALAFNSRIATAIFMLGYYIRLLVVPYPLICDYSFNSIPYVGFGNIWVLLSLVGYLFLAFFSVRRLLKDRKDPYAFVILFFLASISLFSNIPFLIGSTMAERFTFFASAGFCLLLALLIEQFVSKKEEGMAILKNTKVLGVIAVIGLSYTVITVNRNADWADEHTLFKTDLEKAPNDSRLNYYLGDEILTSMLDVKDPVQYTQMDHDVISYLSKAISIYPRYTKAHFDIANAYWVAKQYDSAEAHFKMAGQLNFKGIRLPNNLAHMYFDWGKYPLAIQYNRAAMAFAPDAAKPYANIGLCFQALGQYDSAIYYANKAILIDPQYVTAYNVLLASYKATGHADSVAKYETILGQGQH